MLKQVKEAVGARLVFSMALAPLWLNAGPAMAHSGHGMPDGGHWHAGDAAPWLLGLAALVVALAAAAFINRRR